MNITQFKTFDEPLYVPPFSDYYRDCVALTFCLILVIFRCDESGWWATRRRTSDVEMSMTAKPREGMQSRLWANTVSLLLLTCAGQDKAEEILSVDANL